jgi:hypothetical protein
MGNRRLLAALCACLLSYHANADVRRLAPALPSAGVAWTPIPVPVQGCCKMCSKGKACGDSCIARDRSCKKGQGCACDG